MTMRFEDPAADFIPAVERVFGTDSDGSVKIEYHPGGVECVLNAPAAQLPTAPY